jgi:ArsR family transcriptional regulator, arsenate/arsenite/antimonite-responsive transcriptional repressor
VKQSALFFKVLADEARLQMLWLLFNHEELCVCDFTTVLDVTQSKASRHLATLKHARLVSDRKEGLWTHYALCPLTDALERQHLALLRATLASRPEAKPLVAKLQKWLKAKDRSEACRVEKACDCAPPKARKSAKNQGRSRRASGKEISR